MVQKRTRRNGDFLPEAVSCWLESSCSKSLIKKDLKRDMVSFKCWKAYVTRMNCELRCHWNFTRFKWPDYDVVERCMNDQSVVGSPQTHHDPRPPHSSWCNHETSRMDQKLRFRDRDDNDWMGRLVTRLDSLLPDDSLQLSQVRNLILSITIGFENYSLRGSVWVSFRKREGEREKLMRSVEKGGWGAGNEKRKSEWLA